MRRGPARGASVAPPSSTGKAAGGRFRTPSRVSGREAGGGVVSWGGAGGGETTGGSLSAGGGRGGAPPYAGGERTHGGQLVGVGEALPRHLVVGRVARKQDHGRLALVGDVPGRRDLGEAGEPLRVDQTHARDPGAMLHLETLPVVRVNQVD